MAGQTGNVFIYPRNEPGTRGHLDLVEPLRELPNLLRAELQGIADAYAARRPAADQWCIKEIVAHLRDAAEVDHKRLYMMSTQTDPILEPYDQEGFARDHGYMERSIDSMVDELSRFRSQTVELLTTLVNWNWARSGQHLEAGRMSIRQIVEHMVEHEAAHVDDIRRLRKG